MVAHEATEKSQRMKSAILQRSNSNLPGTTLENVCYSLEFCVQILTLKAFYPVRSASSSTLPLRNSKHWNNCKFMLGSKYHSTSFMVKLRGDFKWLHWKRAACGASGNHTWSSLHRITVWTERKTAPSLPGSHWPQCDALKLTNCISYTSECSLVFSV